MEEEIMVIKIIATIIGAMILGAGLYYLSKEKKDPESKKNLQHCQYHRRGHLCCRPDSDNNNVIKE